MVEYEFRVSGYITVTMHTPAYANRYSYMLPLLSFLMSFLVIFLMSSGPWLHLELHLGLHLGLHLCLFSEFLA